MTFSMTGEDKGDCIAGLTVQDFIASDSGLFIYRY